MKTLPISLLLCGLSASLSMADAGDWMSVQGLLQQADGLSYADGNYTLCFSLHTEATGGDSLWEECKSVPVEDGLYHAVIGDTKPLPAPSLHANWMGISIDGTALSGRLPVTGGNRAARAQHAVLSDTALYSQSAAFSDTSAYSRLSELSGQAQRALHSDSATYSDKALHSQSAAFSDTSGYSRLSGLSGQAQRSLHSDSAAYSDKALHSHKASLVQDSVADGARLGTGIAVRSLNGLRDEVVLEAAGSVSLSVRGDTLELLGKEALQKSSADSLYLARAGEMQIVLWPAYRSESADYEPPVCQASTEGTLYYYGKNCTTSSPCHLRLCTYSSDSPSRYNWKRISLY